MLAKCRRDQWSVDDLDWSQRPRSMSRPDEVAVVQYFTNMSGIELLAGALFQEQRERTDDPVLKEIFDSFVTDEVRHSQVAARLARYYDVHHYQPYAMDVALARFTPHFVDAVRHLSAEIANIYITTGELILDVALLRSLNDYVDDAMSHEAMELINRDESRHIAIDFHMVEYYSSESWLRELERRPRRSLLKRLQAWWALANMFYFAAPFFRRVFFEPMDLTDPGGRRILEAFKRIQILGARRSVAERPFNAFLLRMQALHEHRLAGPVFGRVVRRVLGLQPRLLRTLYTEAEAEEARRMSFDEMAQEALQAKFA